jgi:class 3 adenylate cyclase
MNTAVLESVYDWLIDGARSAQTAVPFLKELCERLVLGGIPLWRVGAFVRTPHPDVFGRSFIWKEGADDVTVTTADFDLPDSPRFTQSPLAILFGTRKEVRFRLDSPESKGFPFFDDMRAEQVTDYLALPLLFTDNSTHAISWLTKQPGGFTDGQLAWLRKINAPFARLAEIFALRRTASTLLDTYVGNSAGERILAGQIRRGHTEAMQAAIWLSDLRGFTALSDRLPAENVVEILNQYFDCQVASIRAHGGEVLKYMGDGLLAVFPIDEYVSDRGKRRTFSFRSRVAPRKNPVRQYRRRQPARLHLYRSCREPRRAAGKDRQPSPPHDRGVGRICRHLPGRLERPRRIPDRRLFESGARLRAARRIARGVTIRTRPIATIFCVIAGRSASITENAAYLIDEP